MNLDNETRLAIAEFDLGATRIGSRGAIRSAYEGASCPKGHDLSLYRRERETKRGTTDIYCIECRRIAKAVSRRKVDPNVKIERQHTKGYRKSRAVHDRRRNLKKYGLTEDSYQDMLTSQDGRCAVCLRVLVLEKQLGSDGRLSMTSASPVIDHNHGTNKVRGILCNPCNRAVGFVRDDPKIARAIAEYLESR